MHAVEIDLAALHFGDEFLRADHVGTGRLRLVGLGAAREHRDALRAARAVRQVDHAAHHLVGMARIDAEVHRDLDGLVELRLGALLDELHRLVERIGLRGIDTLARLGDAFALCHDYAPTSMPIERADPSTMRIAASTVSQLRSAIFFSAISFTCALVIDAGLVAAGRLRAAFELGGLLDEVGHRRGAHLEGERLVAVDRDHDRDRRALLHLRGLRVEVLAERHDVEAALTERGTDRRGRIGRARRDLQFEESSYFLRHLFAPVSGADLDGWRAASPPTCCPGRFAARDVTPCATPPGSFRGHAAGRDDGLPRSPRVRG